MNSIYITVGMSRQNFHKRLDYQMEKYQEKNQLIKLIREVRKDHPVMSARYMYKLIKPEYMGRDKFESFCYENGFRVQIPKNYRRTTDSSGVIRFPNLIPQMELTCVNQVLVSDITYYEMGSRFYYLTFIMDLYIRKIQGYSASKSLHTKNTTIPALKMALKAIGKEGSEGMIIHSDGGGQYYCKEFRQLTMEYKMRNSMGENVFENPHAERLNGVIKNNYLKHYGPENINELTRMLKKAVNMYNNEKPHTALNGLSPVAYQKHELLSIEI
jgi:putative transposase